MADPGTPPAPAGHDPKAELLRAAQAAVEQARARSAAPRRAAGSTVLRRFLLVGGLALFGVAVYLLAVRPAWFFTPPAPAEPREIREASIRLMLVRESQRVEAYRRENGRLPETLAEAGSRVQGVGYLVAGDGTFELFAGLGRDTIRFRSTDSIPAFLGNSLQAITGRAQDRDTGGTR